MTAARALTSLLTNPLAMAIKQPIRHLWWNVKGAGVRNPPVPRGVTSVLFVCLGNICRSPFAALLAERRLSDARVTTIRCASAGIRTSQAARPPAEAAEVAAHFGLSMGEHRPQTLTREMVDAHDLIVVMEAGQLETLREAFPDATGRIVLLSLFDREATGYERFHIADPFAQPRAAFEACYRRIDRALDVLLRELTDGPPDRSTPDRTRARRGA